MKLSNVHIRRGGPGGVYVFLSYGSGLKQGLLAQLMMVAGLAIQLEPSLPGHPAM